MTEEPSKDMKVRHLAGPELDLIRRHLDNAQLRMEREYDLNDLEVVAEYYIPEVTALVAEIDRLREPQGNYATDLPAIVSRLEEVRKGLDAGDRPVLLNPVLATHYEADVKALAFEVVCRRAAMNMMIDSPFLEEWKGARARTDRAKDQLTEALRLAMTDRTRVRLADARNLLDQAITQEAYEAACAAKLIEAWMLQAGVPRGNP